MGKKLFQRMFFSIIVILSITCMANVKSVKAEEADNLIFNLVSDTNVVEINENISLYLTINNVSAIKGKNVLIKYDPAMAAFSGSQCENSERCMFIKDKDGQLQLSLISDLEANLNHNFKKLIRLDFKGIKRGQTTVKIDSGRTSTLDKKVTSISGSQCGKVSFTIHDANAESLERIVAGNGALSDYTALNLNSVNAENLQFVNADLKTCSYTTYEQVKGRIDENMSIYESKVNSMDKVVNGEAILNDYANLGISTVTGDIISYVNEDLKEYNNSSLTAVINRINDYLAKYRSMAAINAGNASLNDYRNIGVSAIYDYNLCYVNNKIKNSSIVNITKMSTRVNDIAANLKTYTVKGIVRDAKNSTGVSGALIKFKCCNGQYLTKNGTQVTATSDSNGSYSIALPEGRYTAEVSKTFYISTNISVTADVLSAGNNFNINMTPVASTKYKVELRWGSNPGDLDGVIYGKTGAGLKFTCMQSGRQEENGNVIASATSDCVSGYGPESITFTADYNGSYKYAVHSHNGSGTLEKSNAVARLYQNDILIGIYYIPQSQSGNYWYVFEITNGQILSRNTIVANENFN